jgi:hypothetical protein
MWIRDPSGLPRTAPSPPGIPREGRGSNPTMGRAGWTSIQHPHGRHSAALYTTRLSAPLDQRPRIGKIKSMAIWTSWMSSGCIIGKQETRGPPGDDRNRRKYKVL